MRARLQPMVAVGMIAAVALAVPLLPLPDPISIDVAHRMAAVSRAHWLGQDEYGRDVLSRLLWGARVSLSVAFASATIACVVGTALGLIGGFLGGWVKLVTVRSMDIVLCFPPLLLALLVVTLLGPGASTLIPVLAVVYLPGFVRQAYAGALAVRSLQYVEAVKVLGAGRLRIMLLTILPNIAGPILVQYSLAVAAAIVLESGLSFLGLGVVPPWPSWGLMIGAARSTMSQAPQLLLWPCLALTGTVLAMNALCDSLRDSFDPHRAPPRRSRWSSRFENRGAVLDPDMSAALDVRGLSIVLDAGDGAVRVVRDVSLRVGSGETVALVGESGSGKSLTGLAVMGLLPPVAHVEAGSAWVDGTEVLSRDDAGLRRLRGPTMAMVFQDSLSSLNPVHRVGAQLVEAIAAHQNLGRNALTTRVGALMRQVGIPDPTLRAKAFPHEMSGGMSQRAMIALAIANDPRLLIADEPTTALDATVQAQVIALLADLKRDRDMGLLFITHNLPLVAEIADRVVVMYAGEIVEQGPVALVIDRPMHPYTAALLNSVPSDDGRLPVGIPGNVPALADLPSGCLFAPRCGHRIVACESVHPDLVALPNGRATRCIRWPELEKA